MAIAHDGNLTVQEAAASTEAEAGARRFVTVAHSLLRGFASDSERSPRLPKNRGKRAVARHLTAGVGHPVAPQLHRAAWLGESPH